MKSEVNYKKEKQCIEEEANLMFDIRLTVDPRDADDLACGGNHERKSR